MKLECIVEVLYFEARFTLLRYVLCTRFEGSEFSRGWQYSIISFLSVYFMRILLMHTFVAYCKLCNV